MWKGFGILFIVFFSISLPFSEGKINEQASKATNEFSISLLKTVLKQNSRNVVVSPVSIHILLAILLQGAKGSSKQQVERAIHAQSEEAKLASKDITDEYENYNWESGSTMNLNFNTKAFLNVSFKLNEEFKQCLIENFNSDIDLLNFNNGDLASDTINKWVRNKTNNRIPELFKPDDFSENTALVLVNAVYFKSYWENKFYSVENKSFSAAPGENEMVPTLSHKEVYNAGECKYTGAKFVHMALKTNNIFSVLLILPTEKYGLETMVERLTANNLTNIFNHKEDKKVTLQIPKFRLKTDSELINVLKQLGVTEVFTKEADLSGISTNNKTKVSKFIQRAEIAADENGVTASAATGLVMEAFAAKIPHEAENLEFIADEPFLFFIVDRINSVPLFAGRVTNPSCDL